MATDKKVETNKLVETLEDEFKLIKGELKETLGSVRDYLLNSELPASEYAQIMKALYPFIFGNQLLNYLVNFTVSFMVFAERIDMHHRGGAQFFLDPIFHSF